MPEPSPIGSTLRSLLRAGQLVGVEQLPGLLRRHAAAIGIENVHIYVVDLREEVLRELTGRGANAGADGESLPVDGTLAGLVYRHTRVTGGSAARDVPGRLWLPLLGGTERIGVLRADIGASADRGAVEEALRDLASLTSMLLVAKRAASDSYARLVRTRPMGVSAEMQWSLMPPMSFADDQVVLAATMEPAYEIAGDAFDYAVAGQSLHLAIVDAMGHDSAAGLTANLAMAACRASRRKGIGLIGTTNVIERTLLDQFGTGRYATGLFAELDTASGELTWVNRGHHEPVLIRGCSARTLRCEPGHPMGTDLGLTTKLCHEQLQPEDRILMYTDGVIEARDRAGGEFGLARFVEFVLREQAEGLPVAETLRRLIRALMAHHEGMLNDDATVVFAEWRGGTPPGGFRARHPSAPAPLA
ncbi:PP2C family protein-serine/threonine phosphatase [Streptomyces montanisoli]|uniref:Serine/threonine-protein phosphatase n=1 Tax=Streptomyces montanisoli TaxID=2798581 RepID=A0A940RTX5_9ACTN|nr:PP2C family protein-serine/threonine phosphatase [Streptomyces montanisoli]MBP0456565.1 serine/threonine-protein phosphatase [Streptomyces montanisoli]